MSDQQALARKHFRALRKEAEESQIARHVVPTRENSSLVYYNPLMPEVIEDPLPIYKQLRDEAPAYYVEEFDC